MARISLWGFYQFTNKTLFDNIKLYEGFDKNILVDLILQQSGELFPFHQQPMYLQANIENWFSRMYEQFKRSYEALYSDYNPIENYDRHEDWSDSESASMSTSESVSTSESSSASGHDSTSDSSSNSMTNDISAANQLNGFTPDTASNGVSAGRSTSDTNNQTTTAAKSDRINASNNERFSKHSGRLHGNIGVTTTQQMIESELQLRKYDIYQEIANMFEKEFMTRVY